MNKKSIVPEPPDSDCEDKDELRARFTGWLEQTLYRAKLKYIKKNRQQMIIVSLEELQAEVIADPVDRFTYIARNLTDFDFEEEKLAAAFYELPLMRREVLRLLFAEQKTPEEISHQLHCSVNYVYLQKSRALRKLRADLEKGGNKHNKE